MNIKIGFLALKSRASKSGKVPIYCILSNSKGRIRFSIKLDIEPANWDAIKQKAKGKSPEAIFLNQNIEDLKRKVFETIQKLNSSVNEYSLIDIVNTLHGKTEKHPTTILAVYKHKFDKMQKLLGKDYTQSTLSKYSQMAKAVQEFIRIEFKLTDIQLSKLNRPFLDDLEQFLRTEKGMKPISSNKVIQGLKSAVIYALEREWISRNPFIGHSFKRVETEIKYLNNEQIIKLETTTLSQPRLELVKKLFLFSVYTGLHYADAMSLTQSNLINGVDGKLWIEYVRGKTGKRIQIPLLNKAQALLSRFEINKKLDNYLLPRISNQKMNSYLKEISDILDIDIPLTHKIARKTFGSILLYHNVPIKVVSELMGHSNSLITERHYAKLDTRKLGESMRLLE